MKKSKIKAMLADALGQLAASVEHIGSLEQTLAIYQKNFAEHLDDTKKKEREISGLKQQSEASHARCVEVSRHAATAVENLRTVSKEARKWKGEYDASAVRIDKLRKENDALKRDRHGLKIAERRIRVLEGVVKSLKSTIKSNEEYIARRLPDTIFADFEKMIDKIADSVTPRRERQIVAAILYHNQVDELQMATFKELERRGLTFTTMRNIIDVGMTRIHFTQYNRVEQVCNGLDNPLVIFNGDRIDIR